LVWYVRVGHGPRVRVSPPNQTQKFRAEYLAAFQRASERPAPGRQTPGTLAWLVEEHMRSAYWLSLKPATRRQRENILKRVLETAGAADYRRINAADIVRGRERRAETPSQANNYLNTMKALFGWAVEVHHLAANPAAEVKTVRRPRTPGFVAWTDQDLAAFEARWALGTRERLAYELLRFTGLRRGDIVRLGPQHRQAAGKSFPAISGYFRLLTEKTGTYVSIPIDPALDEVLAASPLGRTTYLARRDGRPMVKEAYANWFKEACVAAGVAGTSHGLRKYAATHLTHLGVSDAQLEAVMGWVPGSQMTGRYTRERNTERLAAEAARVISRTRG
jgi:integrase